MAEWTTIESDPGVFTELMEKMGVQGVQASASMEEIYSLDSDSLGSLKPIYGLIFLFKWQKETDDRPVDTEYEQRGIFYASQIINNACATQLRDFTAGFPPDMKGLAIGNSDAIRRAAGHRRASVHNSFHPPQSIVPEKDEDEKGGEAFHFIAYLPIAGGLYELDGLKPGPLRLAECSECNSTATHTCCALQAPLSLSFFLSLPPNSEIRFNVMALIRDRREVYTQAQAAARRHAARIRARLQGEASPPPEAAVPAAVQAPTAEEEALPADPDTLRAALAEAEEAAERAGVQLGMEEDKRRRWEEENLRRRCDFVPAIFHLLQARGGLAEQGKLQPLVDRAVEAAKQKAAQGQESGGGDDE
eukprot:scaffold29.g5942.t1